METIETGETKSLPLDIGATIVITNAQAVGSRVTVRAPDGSEVVTTLPPGAEISVKPMIRGYTLVLDKSDDEPGVRLLKR